MSWVPKWSSWGGRLSPFARTPQSGSTQVDDADFSYITTDDLRRHQQEGGDVADVLVHNNDDSGSDSDVIIARHKGKDYHIHFTPMSIARGAATIGHVRDAIARKSSTPQSQARDIKLLYKGKNLKDDDRSCKAEGLRSGSEILCIIPDVPIVSPSQSEDDDEGEDVGGVGDAANGDPTRKRRNRGNKTKRRNKREAAAVVGSTNLEVPNSGTSTRDPSPKPTTPLEKLAAISTVMKSFLPQCQKFQTDPPVDPAKREFEYKRLSETILAQVLLKLDGVDSEGDEDARLRRKALVKEAQDLLSDLDAVMKR